MQMQMRACACTIMHIPRLTNDAVIFVAVGIKNEQRIEPTPVLVVLVAPRGVGCGALRATAVADVVGVAG
eukprot:748721-Prymnesium_polylepis.1